MYMNDGIKTKINLRNKSVFITGVAGFIGSNLAKRLLSTVEGVKVVGLDNMNHYYDVRLKEARLNELEQFDNFSFVKGNLADKAVIESIFEQYKPEIVVNLGAQAGVRYSITNPDAYVEANLIGFYNILEACRHSYDEGHTPVEHLVYASSSSVYGSNKKVPYSTDDKVDNPVSLYAATKKSNELMAHGAEESKKVCYYICRARQADDKCIGHQITEKLLKALVMDQLHLFIVRLSDKRKILEELRKIEDMQSPVYRAKSEVMSLTDKVGQMAKKREQFYADYVAGAVDSEEYQQIREEYSRQYDSLRTALQRAEAKKMEVEQQIREYLNMTSNLEAHLDDFGFDAQLVKSLVQRIEVSADKRIRIVFGFQDVLADFGKESAGK